jgi:hypothetical protein
VNELGSYFLLGTIFAIVFLISLTYNPAVGMALQQFLPHDFSKRKTLYKALLGIIIAWPAMIAYVWMTYNNRNK